MFGDDGGVGCLTSGAVELLTLFVLRQVTELFEESKTELEQRTAELDDKKQR